MLNIPIPPSANGMWKKTRQKMYRSPKYQAWLDVAVPLIRLKYRGIESPIRIEVAITGGKGWRINRDLDNVFKPLIDGIKLAEIVPDDTTAYVTSISGDYFPPAGKKSVAKCEINITSRKATACISPATEKF